MSTRWYPLYQKGNPQLRVFLPNFWMKVVKPQEEVPKNVVHFKVSNEMTEFDVRNYLTKIYKLPVVAVQVEMKNGNVVRTVKNYIIKDDDYKLAQVTMTKDFEFSWPDIPDKPGMDIYDKSNEQNKKTREELEKKYQNRPGIPTWFGH